MPAFPKPTATETDPVASPLVEAEAEARAEADSAHAALTTTAHGGIVASSDARLTNARTPTAHKSTHATGGTDVLAPSDIGAATAAAVVTAQSTADGAVVLVASKADSSDSRFPTSSEKSALAGTGTPSGSNKYVTNDDSRLTNSRTPSAHAASHKTGGSDSIKLDELAAPTDVTTLNASTSQHGLLPKLDGSASKALLGDGSWGTVATGGAAVYGDGSDGNVTISTTVTLTRDMYYDTLTVANGGVLKTSGYRVFCKTACAVNSGSVIHNDGGDGADNTGGAQSPTNGTLGNGAAGVNGSSAGVAGNGQAQGFGGNGGAGGSGTSGAGGAAGTVSMPTRSYVRALPFAIIGNYYDRSAGWALAQGGASGGTGGAGTVNGSASGAGGGVVMLCAKAITNNGRISANGGAGGSRSTGANWGGGGGGGGGLMIAVYNTLTGTTPTANGGTGGAGNGTGTAGSNGSAGTVVLLVGV